MLTTISKHELYAQTFNKITVIDSDTIDAVMFKNIHFLENSNVYVCDFGYLSLGLGIQSDGLVSFSPDGSLHEMVRFEAIPNKMRIGYESFVTTDYIYIASDYWDTTVLTLTKTLHNLQNNKTVFINYTSLGKRFHVGFVKVINPNKILIGGMLDLSLTYANQQKAMLLIVDSLGNITNTIAHNKPDLADNFLDIHIDRTKNEIWISGNTFDFFEHDQFTYGSPFVLKYDTNWNKLNEYYYYDTLQTQASYKMAFTDTSFFLASAYGTSSHPQISDHQKPELLESDFSGNEIWSYKDTSGFELPSNFLVDVKIGQNGSIYALGYSFTRPDSNDFILPPSVPSWDYTRQAVLYKWDKNKKLQWIRHIKHPNARSLDSACWPVDLALLPNDSIVFCGTYYPGMLDSIYSQMGWIVKTDSNGCFDDKPCIDWLTVGLQDLFQPTIEPFDVFPNPSNSETIYTKHNFSINNKVSIFSIDGKLIFQTKFMNNQLKIPTVPPDGSYIIIVNDENQVFHSIINFTR
jgi:hypothetical protein